MLRETEEAVRWATQGLPLVGFPRIQRLADVSHLGLLNRAGGTASTLCTVAHGLALAQGAGMRATPEARYLAQATREACTAERIPCWEPHDG